MTGQEFDKYFRKLYLPLGMYALRIIGDSQISEDLVSDAFTKVWQKIGEGIEINNFRAYMYQSVRNECLTFLRNKKDFIGLEEIPDINEETIDTSERDAKIWKAIDELPEKCRKVFLLSKQEGLSNEEIAQDMEISIKTVKNQMTKAFSRLREALSSGHKPFFLPFL